MVAGLVAGEEDVLRDEGCPAGLEGILPVIIFLPAATQVYMLVVFVLRQRMHFLVRSLNIDFL